MDVPCQAGVTDLYLSLAGQQQIWELQVMRRDPV